MKALERDVVLYMNHLGQVNQELNRLNSEAQGKVANEEKSNNDAPDLSDIYVLVNMNTEKNVGRPLLELDFEFFKEVNHKEKIRGI